MSGRVTIFAGAALLALATASAVHAQEAAIRPPRMRAM